MHVYQNGNHLCDNLTCLRELQKTDGILMFVILCVSGMEFIRIKDPVMNKQKKLTGMKPTNFTQAITRRTSLVVIGSPSGRPLHNQLPVSFDDGDVLYWHYAVMNLMYRVVRLTKSRMDEQIFSDILVTLSGPSVYDGVLVVMSGLLRNCFHLAQKENTSFSTPCFVC